MECTFLEKINAKTLALAMTAIINKGWPNFDTLLGRLLLSDGVSYLLKDGTILNCEFNKELFHLTCLIHTLHRLCKKVCSVFKDEFMN